MSLINKVQQARHDLISHVWKYLNILVKCPCWLYLSDLSLRQGYDMHPKLEPVVDC